MICESNCFNKLAKEVDIETTAALNEGNGNLHEITLAHGKTPMLPLFMYISIHEYMLIYLCYPNVSANVTFEIFCCVIIEVKTSNLMFVVK